MISNVVDVELIKSRCPDYKDCENENLEIKRLGGLSNFVFKVLRKDQPNIRPITQKVYSSQFNILNDRLRENEIAQEMQRAGMGPKIYYADTKVRIEEFLEYQSISTTQMNEKHVRNRIAHLLGFIHIMGQRPQLAKYDTGMPMFKRTLMNKQIKLKIQELAHKREDQDSEKKDFIVNVIEQIYDSKFIDDIFKLIENVKCEICFTHNDANNTNFLYDSKSDHLFLIDYEAVDYNQRGYEFGNLFNELTWDQEQTLYPYFKVNSTYYPNDFEQQEFFAHYLFSLQYHKGADKQNVPYQYISMHYEQIYKLYADKGEEIEFIETIKQLKRETEVGRLLSNIFLIIIAGLSLAYTELSLDLHYYIKLRWESISTLKPELFAKYLSVKQ